MPGFERVGEDSEGGEKRGRTRDNVGEGLGGADAALGVPGLHDLDLDAEDTLTHEDVAGGRVDKVADGLTRVDHEAVGELHRLGTGGTELARDDNLATLGARLHDEAEDTVASAVVGRTGERGEGDATSAQVAMARQR